MREPLSVLLGVTVALGLVTGAGAADTGDGVVTPLQDGDGDGNTTDDGNESADGGLGETTEGGGGTLPVSTDIGVALGLILVGVAGIIAVRVR
jgi:hypothetical protein